MKRFIALVFPIIVVVGVVITITALEARRVPDWKIKLSAYMTQSRLPAETITIQDVAEATKPWNFSKTMSRAVRNDDWARSVDDVPFPPSEIQCVLLERTQKSTAAGKAVSTPQIIFVGHHSDALWRINWLVHEGPIGPFTKEFRADLDAIGCNLNLE